jgi:hypothetical protein
MKTNFAEQLNYRLTLLNRSVSELQAKLDGDFLYYFAWVGEELWQKKYEAKYITEVLQAMEGLEQSTSSDNPCPVRQIILIQARQLRDITTRPYNVRVNSTGALHREVSTLQFQCQLELYIYFNELLNR